MDHVPGDAFHFQLLPPEGPLQNISIRLNLFALFEKDLLGAPLSVRGIRLNDDIGPQDGTPVPRSEFLEFDGD